MWFTASVLAAPVLLGEPAWRAPDGIVDAVVTSDGTTWTRSNAGEIAGFDRKGVLQTNFQACPTRAGYLGTAVNPRGTRLAVDCGGRLRLFALPSGSPVADIPIHVDGMNFDNADGLGVVGRRELETQIEDDTQFLVYDGSGNLRTENPSTWEVPYYGAGGWAGATGPDEEDFDSRPALVVQGAGGLNRWTWTAPETLHSTDTEWRAHNAIAVLGDSRLICAAMNHAVQCLDTLTGVTKNTWTDLKSTLQPAGPSLGVGDAAWFLRDRELVSWSEGLPVKLAGADARSPISNAKGSVRFLVEESRLVPVDGSGEPLPDTRNQWDIPVDIRRSATGSLLVLDRLNRVFQINESTGESQFVDQADAIAFSPSGRMAWLRQGKNSVLIDLDAKRRTALDGGLVADFDSQDMLLMVDAGQLRRVDGTGAPTTILDLPAWVEEPESLRVRDQRVLLTDAVGYALAIDVALKTAGERLPYERAPRNAARLVPDAVVVVDETEEGDWQVGSTILPHTEWVRIQPDGDGLVTLTDDAKHLQMRRMDGSIRKRYDLPARFADAWVFDHTIVVALRDGRLMPLSY